jgi:uncharacterized Zn finger protein
MHSSPFEPIIRCKSCKCEYHAVTQTERNTSGDVVVTKRCQTCGDVRTVTFKRNGWGK